jgi:bifunctional pyridoxal-dependent enzyme with beta-cystathionase and maltose regulon repressor activities
MSLCDAIAERMDRKHGWKVKPDWLCFTAGVVPALKAVVVIPDPDLSTYSDCELWRSPTEKETNGFEQVLDYIRGNLELLLRFFEDKVPAIRPFPPEATYLVWLDCREFGMDSSTLDRIFQEAGVGLMSGTDFGPGGEGFTRINVACPRRLLEEALGRIERAVESLA